MTDKQLLANKPDKMVADKEQKRAVVIDVAIPARVPGTDVEVGSQSGPGGDRSKLTGRVASTNMLFCHKRNTYYFSKVACCTVCCSQTSINISCYHYYQH